MVVISLEQSEYLVLNENDSLSVKIIMSNVTSQGVIVEVTITDGTATGKYMHVLGHILLLISLCLYTLFFILYISTAGMDYNVIASVFNVTLSTGAISSSFNIDIIDDVIHEDNETFTITIRLLPSCLSLSLGTSSSTVNIVDSDGK